ncbi:MAG TPA: DUF1566 domain-containing protein [Ideonella sp.]|nr:DUF1566 domain-containing protein [Ideonella sp.]
MSSRLISLMATATVLACGTTPALAKNQLNDTGMLQCLTSGGYLTSSCANTGQDGSLGRDVERPNAKDGRLGFSFVRVCNSGVPAGEGSCPKQPELGPLPDQWGCTLDRVTGLLWEVKTSDGGSRDYRNTYTNFGDKRAGDVSRYPRMVNATGLCGKKNWRLPSPNELLSIADHGVPSPGPTIDTQWFPNTVSNGMWTDAPYTPVPEEGRTVTFYYGNAGIAMRYFGLGVRLVSKPVGHAERFVANGDEVTDTSTGLIWRRCSEGQAWTGGACSGSPAEFYGWHNSLNYAKSVAQATGVAWRVPNIKELFSIVDTLRWSPAIDPAYFPQTSSQTCYWSSTPDATPPDEGFSAAARCVGFNVGEANSAGFDDFDNPRFLRLVRNAD